MHYWNRSFYCSVCGHPMFHCLPDYELRSLSSGLCTIRLRLVEMIEKQGDRKCVSLCAFSKDGKVEKKKKKVNYLCPY